MRTGSHRNAIVRGQHALEALWFALGASTPATSIDADAAAEEVIEAARAGRASVSPGWQSRAAEVAHALLPELTASLSAAAAAFVLPGPTADPHGDAARLSREIDLHVLTRVFPTREARHFNQPVAPDEAMRSGAPEGAGQEWTPS
jgi:hypothetical protein